MRLFGETHPVELCFAWEAGTLPTRLRLGDEASARAFVARLSRDGDTAALHRLADPPASRPREHHEMLDLLARWIVSGRLLVRTGPALPLPAFDHDEAELSVERRAPVFEPPPEEALPPPEEALPPVTVDGAQQAAVLRLAAEKGIPFCEECERKKKQKAPPEDDTAHLDQAAMARTLVRAAEEGVPVCEECERLARPENRAAPPLEDDEDDEDEDDEDDEDDAGTR